MDDKGLFLVLEGPEGSGKSTQAALLENELRKRGIDVVVKREPGGTKVGESIRAVLLDTKHRGMPAMTEFFLFQASRAAFIRDVVRPALDEGKVVIADRFDLSTMAYQISGRRLPERPCLDAIRIAVGDTYPDAYIVLMVDDRVGRSRQRIQGKKADRIESEARRFHRRVLGGYKRFSQLLANTHIIETTDKDIDQVHTAIVQYLDEEFGDLVGAEI